VRRSLTRRTTGDDVRRVVLAALATALDDSKQQAAKKPALTGVRAVATGAVIYTAGRAAFSGRRFISDRLASDSREDERGDEDQEEYDEPEAEERDEPEAEEYDEPEAEERDEPEAEERDEPEAEEHDEPEAEAEERDDEPEQEPVHSSSSRRPPVHSDRSPDERDPDLPSRPSRSRAPLGRA
jgi:outer membrane biosynthesis protein TonB